MTGVETDRGPSDEVRHLRRIDALRPNDPRRLGDYDIVGLLGEGGMGRVYLARSTTGRLVAVKVIRAELATDDEYRRRFRAEVELAKQVPSFSTAEVLDADPDHDPPYLVVEFIDGPSLAEVVADSGPLTAANLRGFAISVAAALTAIHDAGVIHRDLKPTNVLLSQGCAKVIDFGIARPSVDAVQITGANNVMGTVAYMSPERFFASEGDAITSAADIFAWGAVVTFAGTGRIAFPAESTAAVIGRIINDAPDLTGLTEPLLDLVRQALAKDPLQRPTAGDLIDALTRADRAVSPHRERTVPADPDPAPSVPHSLITPPVAVGRSPVPHQVVAPAQSFTGRTRQLAELTDALHAGDAHARPAAIAAITGVGGVGKTSLVARWAHENVKHFPDGQFYVDLRGFEPGADPVAPSVALSGLLEVLGVAPAAIPDDVDAQAALYRSLIADRHMLIIFDNAFDSAHVIPLLPGAASCVVLVTSRQQLDGLTTAYGAHPLSLDGLTEAEARHLLVRRLGSDRAGAEGEAVNALMRHCAGLPLALGIVAARAATHRHFPLATLAGELQGASSRPDNVDIGELTGYLQATLSSSYHALPPDIARTFRLLGITPGPDISLRAAASLLAMSPTRTRRHLRDLTRAHLLQEHSPDRFRMHDLVRLYAAERARTDETPDAQPAAMRRLTDFYLHTAYAGDRMLYPQRPPITLDPPAAGCRPYALRDHTAAMDWFDTNHACILAIHRLVVRERQDTIVWQLAWSLTVFQWRRGQLQDHLAVWQAGLAAAERLGNRTAQAEAHRLVGHACGQAGRHTEALEHLQRALAFSEDVADTFGTAHAHLLLAWITDALGRPQKALTHAKNALRLARILNEPVWVAIALEAIGWYHARLGNFDQAQSFCEESLVLHRESRHPEGEAAALQTLGYIAFHTGQSVKAQHFYLDALALRRDQGDTYSEATILERLGEAYEAYDQHDHAGRAWQHALRLYQSQLRTRKALALETKLSALYSRTT